MLQEVSSMLLKGSSNAKATAEPEMRVGQCTALHWLNLFYSKWAQLCQAVIIAKCTTGLTTYG